MNYRACERACNRVGGNLACPRDWVENTILKSYVQRDGSALFIGYYQLHRGAGDGQRRAA